MKFEIGQRVWIASANDFAQVVDVTAKAWDEAQDKIRAEHGDYD